MLLRGCVNGSGGGEWVCEGVGVRVEGVRWTWGWCYRMLWGMCEREASGVVVREYAYGLGDGNGGCECLCWENVASGFLLRS